jgi:hypothetical protein
MPAQPPVNQRRLAIVIAVCMTIFAAVIAFILGYGFEVFVVFMFAYIGLLLWLLGLAIFKSVNEWVRGG